MYHYRHTRFSLYPLRVEESKNENRVIGIGIYFFSSVEIWCGCSLGNIRIIDVRTAQLSMHLSHQLASGSSSVQLLCASRDSPYQYSIWTAMKTGREIVCASMNSINLFSSGSFVFVWNHLSRRMVHQLDCEQIIRRSTDANPTDLTIDSILPTRTLVFIGLHTGHIIIVKSISTQVLYTVHAFDQHVFHLFALSSSALSPSTTNQSNDTRSVTQFKQLQERFEQHRFNRDNSRIPLLARTENIDNEPDNLSYMLAIGYGAKACRSISQLQHYSSDAIFLQAWSLDDFLL